MFTIIKKILFFFLILFIIQNDAISQIFFCSDDEFEFNDKNENNVNNQMGEFNLLNNLHIRKGEEIGSSMLIKHSGKAFPDRLVLFPDGLILCMYTNEEGLSKWIMIKVVSKIWLQRIFSQIKNAKSQFLNCIDLTSQEEIELNKLLSLVEDLYCETDKKSMELLLKKSIEDGIVQEDLYKEFVEAKLKAMEEKRRKRYEPKQFPRPGRLIVFNNIVFVVDPVDGFVYKYIDFYDKNKKQDYIRKITTKRGLSVRIVKPTEYFLEVPDYINGGRVKFGRSLIPNNLVVLPDDIRKYYSIGSEEKNEDSIIHDENKLPPGIQIHKEPNINLITCPPDIKTDVNIGTNIFSQEINTYLIDLPWANEVKDWILITSTNCSRCGEIGNSFITEAHSPSEKINLRILNTLGFEALTTPEETVEKKNLLLSLNEAFTLANQGLVKNNTLEYLGEGGFIYETPSGKLTLYLPKITFTYSGDKIDKEAFNKEWLRYFSKGIDKVNISNDKGFVKEIFLDAAKGKNFWREKYYHNPLSFLEKYCEKTTKINE